MNIRKLIEFKNLRDRAYQNYADLEAILRGKGMRVALYCDDHSSSAPTAEFYVDADLGHIHKMCTRDLDKYQLEFTIVKGSKEIGEYYVFVGEDPDTEGKIIIHYGRQIPHNSSIQNRRIGLKDIMEFSPYSDSLMRIFN